jgi:hypothetical protein
VCEQIASRGTLWRCQHEGCERGGQQDGARTYLLVVACLALFFVLDRLDVVHAAGACFRRRARRGRDVLMAAAIFVYDLEAHGGEQRRGAVVARRGAPAVWARGERREGGAGPGRADWPARGSSARRDRTPAATAAGRGQRGRRGRRRGCGRRASGGGRDGSRRQAGCGAGEQWQQRAETVKGRPKGRSGAAQCFIMPPFCVPGRRYLEQLLDCCRCRLQRQRYTVAAVGLPQASPRLAAQTGMIPSHRACPVQRASW